MRQSLCRSEHPVQSSRAQVEYCIPRCKSTNGDQHVNGSLKFKCLSWSITAIVDAFKDLVHCYQEIVSLPAAFDNVFASE